MQRQDILGAGDKQGVRVARVLDLKGVSGTIPFHLRPGVKAFLERAVRAGCKQIIVENERRFARTLEAQESGIKYCKQLGLKVICANDPELFVSEEPSKKMERHVKGALLEYDHNVVVYNMKRGREEQRSWTWFRTLDGRPKVEGRNSFLDLHPNLVQKLSSFIQRPFAARKVLGRSGRTMPLSELSKKLASKGVRTQFRRNQNGGLPINTGRLAEWLRILDKKGASANT